MHKTPHRTHVLSDKQARSSTPPRSSPLANSPAPCHSSSSSSPRGALSHSSPRFYFSEQPSTQALLQYQPSVPSCCQVRHNQPTWVSRKNPLPLTLRRDD